MKRMTAKQRVLDRYPRAIAKYVGLSLKIVIGVGLNTRLSGEFTRERDAWADAARKIQ